MQSLAQLQDRLSAAFGGTAVRAYRGRTAGELSSPAPLRSLYPLLFYWLGGAGLISAILLLLLSHWGGPLVAGLGLVLIAAIAGYLATLLKNGARPGGRSPDISERVDTTGLLGEVHDVLGDIVVTRTMDRRIIGANET